MLSFHYGSPLVASTASVRTLLFPSDANTSTGAHVSTGPNISACECTSFGAAAIAGSTPKAGRPSGSRCRRDAKWSAFHENFAMAETSGRGKLVADRIENLHSDVLRMEKRQARDARVRSPRPVPTAPPHTHPRARTPAPLTFLVATHSAS